MIPFPDKKYKIIYADPAWTYGNWYQSEDVKRNAADHYSCTKTEDMKELPVKNISDDDSVLIMWVTFPCLKEGMELLEAWGFEYKTVAFTWVKKNKEGAGWFMGLGNYTWANAEIALLGTRGYGLPRLSHNVRQILDNKIGEHSQKPAEARNRIVELFGDLPRIELFSRDKIEGWDCWGNEVPTDEQRLLVRE